MKKIMRLWLLVVVLAASIVHADSLPTNSFSIASYNVENWLLMERNRKPDQPKPAASKSAVVDVLAEARPDVVGFQEMGGTNDFAELIAMLAERGLVYPHREWVQGADPTRHVALLSRFPITERRSRVDYTYKLGSNVMPIQRGILDVNIQVNEHYSFRALVVHLKSRRVVEEFDQAEARLGEARLLRGHIAKILKDDPDRNLIAIGDFNDVPDSPALRAVIGEPPFPLHRLNPVDSKGYFTTHLWRSKREWSRIDYLITSPAMANEFVPGSARIGDYPMWEKASDHRLILARFLAQDQPAPVKATPE